MYKTARRVVSKSENNGGDDVLWWRRMRTGNSGVLLALPMVLMFAFGLFGFRPGQMMKGMLGYVVNFIFILNFLLILCVGTGYLFSTDFQSRISNQFLVIFLIFLIMELAILCYMLYLLQKMQLVFSHWRYKENEKSVPVQKRIIFHLCYFHCYYNFNWRHILFHNVYCLWYI